jgi:hypothetical protein
VSAATERAIAAAARYAARFALRDADQRGGGEAGEAFIDAVLEPAG